MQIALALFYLRLNKPAFAEMIISDIIDNNSGLGEKLLQKAVESACQKLRISGEKFWEDTDRGNTNLYFSPDKEYIPLFLELFNKQLVSQKFVGSC